MLGKRKAYSSELAKWARSAETAVRQWLEKIGYTSIHLPNGQYGKDVLSKSECGTEKFFVEIERRSFRTWEKGSFPYSIVNIPERRKIDKETLLFIVRYDMEESLVVFPLDICKSPLKDHPNAFVSDGELFRQVDSVRCLPVSLSNSMERRTIAEMSRENILQWWNLDSGAVLMKERALGDFPPYGMTDQEWRHLWHSMYPEIEKAIFGSTPANCVWKDIE